MVELSNFSLGYRSENANNLVQALQDINLSVKEGEFVAFVGPSGCGKTTILRAVSGLLDAGDRHVEMQGQVRISGVSPCEAKHSKMFGFAFQRSTLLPWRTVEQNVALPLELAGRNDGEMELQVSYALALAEVDDVADRYPHELSGGMQQRVNLARALVHKPQILLMDEPLASLDELTRERLDLALHRIHRTEQRTILFVTHSLREAVFLADRVVILTKKPGKIREIIQPPLPKERTEMIQLAPEFLRTVNEVRKLMLDE